MALPLFKERRFSPRKRLTGLLPGKLTRQEHGVQLECRVMDVSQHGMGIILSEILSESEILELIVDDKPIELKVAWSQRGFGKRNQVRYGLVTCDPDVDLEKLFQSKGCLVK